jgi:putative transposase
MSMAAPLEVHDMQAKYPSDVTDAEWAIIEPRLPVARVGHPLTHERRVLLNAVLYVLRTGCAWRYLPRDFPPWSTVSYHFYKWRDAGLLEQITDTLRAQDRRSAGREAAPTAVILDSQAVKTTEKGGRAAMTAAKR